MSHFVVLVVVPEEKTGDIEAAVSDALMPYHEYECTGYDCFLEDVDITERVNEYIEQSCKSETPLEHPSDEQIAAVRGYFGECRYDPADKKWYDRTNPNAKWDWWVIGGRWSDMLRQMDGKMCDIVRRDNLDIFGMRAEARSNAVEFLDKIRHVLDKYRDQHMSWETVRESFESIDDARKEYHAQDSIKELKRVADSPFLEVDYYYEKSYNDIVADKIAGAVGCFAILKDGTWHERGEMGWFASVSNDMGQDKWYEFVNTTIDQLNPTDHIVVVDCHI